MSERKVCVTCKYEDASKTITSSDPNYPERNSAGIATWCNYYRRYIGNSARQGVKMNNHGIFEDDEWCSNWKHY